MLEAKDEQDLTTCVTDEYRKEGEDCGVDNVQDFGDETIVESMPLCAGFDHPYQGLYAEQVYAHNFEEDHCARSHIRLPVFVRTGLGIGFVGLTLAVLCFLGYRMVQNSESLNESVIQQQASSVVEPMHVADLHQQRVQAQQRLELLEKEYTQRQEEFRKFLRSNPVAQAMTSESDKNFALWAKGRFSVSDSKGKQLYFEVDPLKQRSAFTGSLAVFGSLHLRDMLEAQSAVLRGSVLASSFATEHFLVDDTGQLTAQGLQVQELIAKRLQLEDMYAEKIDALKSQIQLLETKLIQTDEIQGNSARLSSVSLETLQVQKEADIKNLHAQEARLDKLYTQYLEVDELVISQLKALQAQLGNMQADHARIDDLYARQIKLDNMQGNKAQVDDLYARQAAFSGSTHEVLHADQASCNSLSADQLEATKLVAQDIHAQNLSLHQLDAQLSSLKLSAANFGELVIAPPKSEGELLQKILIEAPKDSYAVFIDSPFQASLAPAYLATQKEGERTYLIVRYPALSADQHELVVKWMALCASAS